jgi:hypothetical protein
MDMDVSKCNVSAFIPLISTKKEILAIKHPATVMYAWLVSRLRERAQSEFLPIGMPETFTNLSVTTKRTGEAGYILYEPLDSLAGEITEMPVRVRIGYEYGHTNIGMRERYTLTMLAAEFWQLTHNAWNMFPDPSSERDLDGTIVHKVSQDSGRLYRSLTVDEMYVPPVRIQEENARGTAINHAEDQAHMLQYWAWSQQPVRVGIGVNINNYSCEYWLDIPLQMTDDENEGQDYFAILHQLWLEELSRISPQVAISCSKLGTDYVYKMRYQGNVLKVWYTPGELERAGLDKPLAEKPIPKDKWSDGSVTVLSYPPMSDETASDFGRILLGGQQ